MRSKFSYNFVIAPNPANTNINVQLYLDKDSQGEKCPFNTLTLNEQGKVIQHNQISDDNLIIPRILKLGCILSELGLTRIRDGKLIIQSEFLISTPSFIGFIEQGVEFLANFLSDY